MFDKLWLKEITSFKGLFWVDNKLKKNLNATFTPEGPKPTENGPAPQHWCSSEYGIMDLLF